MKAYRPNSRFLTYIGVWFPFNANLIGYNLYRIKLENNPKNELTLFNSCGGKIVGDL